MQERGNLRIGFWDSCASHTWTRVNSTASRRCRKDGRTVSSPTGHWSKMDVVQAKRKTEGVAWGPVTRRVSAPAP